jgi:hypothetical protein
MKSMELNFIISIKNIMGMYFILERKYRSPASIRTDG